MNPSLYTTRPLTEGLRYLPREKPTAEPEPIEEALPEYQGNVLWRTLKGGKESIGDTMLGLLARTGATEYLPGLEGADADEINRRANFRERELAIGDKDGLLGETATSGIRQGLQSVLAGAPTAALGGVPLLVSQYATDSANRAYTDALDAGLEDGPALRHALMMGSIEGGVTAAFGKWGQGAFENMLAGRGGARGLKDFFIKYANELSEETIIGASQAITESLNGVKELPDKEQAMEQFLETAIATLVGVGAANGLSGNSEFLQNPSRSNAEAAGVSNFARNKQQRTDLARGGMGVFFRFNGENAKLEDQGQRRLRGPGNVVPYEPPPEGRAFNPNSGVIDYERQGDGSFAPAQEQRLLPGPLKLLTGPELDAKESGQAPRTEGDAFGFGLPISQEHYTKISQWLKRNLFADGLQNNHMVDAVFRRDGAIAGNLKELELNAKNLEIAVKEQLGEITPQTSEYLKQAMEDPRLMHSLPEDVQVSLQAMRDHVDALSRQVINLVGDDTELGLTIEENLGTYLTRSYKKFTDPTWKDKALADDKIMADFADWFRGVSEGNSQFTDDEIRTVAAVMLNKNVQDVSDLPIGDKLKQTVKVLRQRKLDSPALRALYGEHKDVFETYATSVQQVAQLAANAEMRQNLIAAGLENGFFSAADDYSNPEHVHTVDLEGYEGVRTDAETGLALKDIYSTAHIGAASKVWMKMMSIPKISATVLSHTATIRNLIGGMPIGIANGVTNFGYAVEGGKLIFKNNVYDHFMKNKTNQQQRQELTKLARLGILEDVSVSELKTMLQEFTKTPENWTGKAADAAMQKGWVKGAGRVYQSMDTVRRAATYYQYKEDYRKALPHLSDEQLDEYVAKIIRDIDPTYSRAGNIAKFISRTLPVGPFAIFSAEMIRTTINRVKLIQAERASGNPELRKLAHKKLLGQVAAAAVPTAFVGMVHSMLGVSDEEEEAVRQRLAPWSRNSDVLVYDKNVASGTIGAMDISYTDPFRMFKAMWNGAMRGEDLNEIGKELLDPFLSEDLFAGALVSWWRNYDERGNPVYDEGLSQTEQNRQIGKFFAKKWAPGSIKSLWRIQDSPAEKKWIEIIASFTGLRASPFEIDKAEYYRNREFSSDLASSDQAINSHIQYGNPDRLASIVESAEAKRQETFGKWVEFVRGSAVLQQKDILNRLTTHLKDARGGSKELAKRVYLGKYQAYKPSKALLRKLQTRVKTATTPSQKEEALRRIEAVKEVFFKSQ